MKKLIKVEEVEGEGMLALMGQRVTLFCQIYIYTGKLVGVNDDFVKLEDAGVVYETGSFNDKEWADMQKLPEDTYIMKNAIEAFTVIK